MNTDKISVVMRAALLALVGGPLFAANVLIVADEFPAMEVLAQKLTSGANAATTIVKQTEMPPDLAGYAALIVYIHRTIGEPAEKAFIAYAKGGGKLILLHHSISSGKRPNRYWFPFLGIRLPEGDVSQGGYKYYDPVTMEFVNLAPASYITTNKIHYPEKVTYKENEHPGFTLTETEVYLNHEFTSPKNVLLGLKFTEPKSGRTYMQDTAGWWEKTEKGCVVYFMAGHSARDFENPVYGQILVNALEFRP